MKTVDDYEVPEISQKEMVDWKRFYDESQLSHINNEELKKQYYAFVEKQSEEVKKSTEQRLEEFYSGSVIPENVLTSAKLLVAMIESRIYRCLELGLPPIRIEELSLLMSFIPGSEYFAENNGVMTLGEYFGIEEE